MQLWTHILVVCLSTHHLLAYRFDFVVNLTKVLVKRNHFETLILFHNKFVLVNIEGPHLEKEFQRNLEVPLITANDDISDTFRLEEYLSLNSLAFVVMNSLTDSIRNTSESALTGLHAMNIVFIVAKPTATKIGRRDLIEFFRWCWNANLLNVIVTFTAENGTRNELFTYSPFPNEIDVRNVTNSTVDGYFWNKVANVRGYKFATPVFIDEPLVMKVHNEKRNQTFITGTAGRLYMEFTRFINATFLIISVSNISIHLHQKAVVQLTMDKVIDVSIHPFSSLLPYKSDGSYPFAHTNVCIILPVVPEIDRSYYVIRAFSPQLWNAILGLLVGFLAIELIANYGLEGRFRVGLSIQSTIAGMINRPIDMSMLPPSVGRRWWTKKLVISLVVFTGFVVTNSYVASLTSLFSTTVYGHQPETLEDILNTNLEILSLDYQLDAYFSTKVFPEALQKRVRIANPDTLAKYRNELNTTYGYIVKEERWKMIDYQQSRLWKPIFKISHNFCVPNLFLSFPMQSDSPFYEIMKSFTLNVESAGLYLHWTEMSYRDAQVSGVIKVFKETSQQPVLLSVAHFKLVFLFIGVSYGVCFGCLVIEKIVAAVCRRDGK